MKIPKKEPVDEIKKIVNSRFITASESMWRTLSFDVHGRDPSIQYLAVCDENIQVVTFCEDKILGCYDKFERYLKEHFLHGSN